MNLPIIIFVCYIAFALLGQARRRSGGKKQRERFDRIRGAISGSAGDKGTPEGEGSALPEKTAPPAKRPPPGRKPARGGRIAAAPENVKGQPLSFEPERVAGTVLGRPIRAGKATTGRVEQQVPAPAGLPAADQRKTLRGMARVSPLATEKPRLAADLPLGEGSLMIPGRQAPRFEGPTHEETIDHMYGLDECVTPAEDFIIQHGKGELNLAEGMIWSQILGQPRCRRPAMAYSVHQKIKGK